jgi:hypothetical protein
MLLGDLGDIGDWLWDAFNSWQDVLDWLTAIGLFVIPVIGLVVFGIVWLVNAVRERFSD